MATDPRLLALAPLEVAVAAYLEAAASVAPSHALPFHVQTSPASPLLLVPTYSVQIATMSLCIEAVAVLSLHLLRVLEQLLDQ